MSHPSNQLQLREKDKHIRKVEWDLERPNGNQEQQQGVNDGNGRSNNGKVRATTGIMLPAVDVPACDCRNHPCRHFIV